MAGKRPAISQYRYDKRGAGAQEALQMLRRVGRSVKPIMKRRGWRIVVLGEMPPEQYLLGLHTSWGLGWGGKIFLRLRDWGNERQFFPFEEIVDTMLHEYGCPRVAGTGGGKRVDIG